MVSRAVGVVIVLAGLSARLAADPLPGAATAAPDIRAKQRTNPLLVSPSLATLQERVGDTDAGRPTAPTGGVQRSPLPDRPNGLPLPNVPPIHSVQAETPASTPPESPPAPPVGPGALTVEGAPLDPTYLGVLVTAGSGCSSCGGRGSGCDSCRGGTHCLPGRQPCDPYPATTLLGRFAGAIYDGVCCPDPCYTPRWTTLANAAFFVDTVRPVTQTRVRADGGFSLLTPDRAEFFWSRADGQGRGPQPVRPAVGPGRLDYGELSLYTEAAVGGFSMYNVVMYRGVDPTTAAGGGGFADLILGTKSLLADSELFQLTLQFQTYIPTGNSSRGLGTGHVSIEPSLLFGLQVSEDTFFQGQVAQWIPIGGDSQYAGGVFHYHGSVNHVLVRPVRDLQVIGTLEGSGWTFIGGSYTDPQLGRRPASGTYLSAGPGVRVSFCDKLDFGIGSAFALTDPHWAAALFRCEFRYRY